MTYADSKLPVLIPNKNRKPVARPPGRRRDPRVYGLQGMTLHGLGDGPSAVAWQSDVMPAQFYENPSWSDEQYLCYGVLVDARRVIWAVPHSQREIDEQTEDIAWINSTSDSYLFDFARICLELEWDADCVRACVLGYVGRKAA